MSNPGHNEVSPSFGFSLMKSVIKSATQSIQLIAAVCVLLTSLIATPEAVNAEAKDGTLVAKAPAATKKVAWPTTIPWQNDYKTTLQYGKMQHKPVLINMTTQGCSECLKLEQQCYSNPAIINYINRTFICMKTDGERGPGTNVKSQYGIQVYPTTLIVDATTGKERGRLTGFYPPNAFSDELARILKRAY